MAKKKRVRGPVVRTFCRAIGSGGTTLDFYPDCENSRIKVVWYNENVPFMGFSDVEWDETTYEADDGHNVSYLSKEDVESLAKALR